MNGDRKFILRGPGGHSPQSENGSYLQANSPTILPPTYTCTEEYHKASSACTCVSSASPGGAKAIRLATSNTPAAHMVTCSQLLYARTSVRSEKKARPRLTLGIR
jgi:hypothetical protein